MLLAINFTVKGGAYIMKFVVESTRVTYWLPVRISPPQSGGISATIGTAGSFPFSGRLEKY